jgi:thiosulfate/3-mercaptopyruvate sulfurtransferase
LQTARYAIHVDLDSLFFDLNSSLPNVMPPPDQFSRAVRNLGIRNVDFVVIYDRDGIYTGTRLWRIFKAMGHAQVGVLDGGFSAWLQHGFPISSSCAKPCDTGDFVARMNNLSFAMPNTC